MAEGVGNGGDDDTVGGNCGKRKVDGDDNDYDSVDHIVVLTLILAMMLMVVMV